MKNRLIYKSMLISLVVLFCTANGVLADDTGMLKTEIARYSAVLFGIVFFSVVIYTGLSIYNRFFVPDRLKNYKPESDSLHSPLDKDDAILKFLNRNRLR